MTTTAEVTTRTRPNTLSAFRYRNFRLYFAGQLVSMSGTWMQIVAQGWLVFKLTQSELWLGIVACAAGLPSLILSPFGGVLIERIPRRRILVVTQAIQMALAFILSALTFAQMVQVWHIVVLAFLLGATNAIDAPARQAFVIDMVGREDLQSGIALGAIMFNASRVFGPAAAGLALVQVGPGWCFFLNGVSFLAVILSLLAMNLGAPSNKIASLMPLTQLKEGLTFSRFHPTIAPLLLLATATSVFSLNVSTLLPAFAANVLNSPDEGYAALTTANGVGAVLAGLLVGWLGHRFGRGRVVTVLAIVAAIATGLFSQTSDLTAASFLTAVSGFSLVLQFVTMNTLIQTEVPDEFRGRVLSLYTLTFFGLAPFGALALGAIADRIHTPNAIALYAIIGGVSNTIILARSPALRRLR